MKTMFPFPYTAQLMHMFALIYPIKTFLQSDIIWTISRVRILYNAL